MVLAYKQIIQRVFTKVQMKFFGNKRLVIVRFSANGRADLFKRSTNAVAVARDQTLYNISKKISQGNAQRIVSGFYLVNLMKLIEKVGTPVIMLSIYSPQQKIGKFPILFSSVIFVEKNFRNVFKTKSNI